jgi:hypothetical protein
MKPKATYRGRDHVRPGCTVLEGCFTTKDGDQPTVVDGVTATSAGVGDGYTVSAPATAVYTITGKAGRFVACVNAWAQIRENASNSAKAAVVKAVDVSTDPWTATIVTQSTAGTAATLSGPIVDFGFVFRHTQARK